MDIILVLFMFFVLFLATLSWTPLATFLFLSREERERLQEVHRQIGEVTQETCDRMSRASSEEGVSRAKEEGEEEVEPLFKELGQLNEKRARVKEPITNMLFVVSVIGVIGVLLMVFFLRQ